MAALSREPTAAELEQAMALRRRVFCDEQGVSERAEFDGLDPESRHLVVVDDEGRVVGTCRLRALAPGTLKLERMAVDAQWRRTGAGRSLCLAAARAAAETGAERIVLHAQRQAEPFYASCGYDPEGETFLEEDIPHVKMVLELK